MIKLILLGIIICAIIRYLWQKYSPYFAFPQFIWCDWRTISTILRSKNQHTLKITLSRMLLENTMKYMKEGIAVGWFPEPILCIFGPEAIKFFVNEASLIDKPFFYKFFDFLGHDGLLLSGGKRARRQRKLINPAFYPRMMKNYTAAMNDHAVHLVQKLKQLENNTADDIEGIVKKESILLFLNAAMSIKTDLLEKDATLKAFINAVSGAFDFVTYRVFRPWLHYDFMLNFFASGRKHKKDVKILHTTGKQIIEDMKKSYVLRTQSVNVNETDEDRYERHIKTFGDVLLEQHFKDPSFTLENVKSDILTLIGAGYDTVSTSLAWTLWLLGMYQDIQEKAFEEVNSFCNEVIECNDADNMPYLECVIKESLRLYPVGPVFLRLSSKDLYFESHKIPKGTIIAFVVQILHLNPDVYPDPETFNPDRFAEKKSDIKPWCYIPFAESVRSCVGKNYAMLQMKIFLTHVIRNFKIVSLTSKEDVEFTWEIILKSSVPLSVKFIPR